MDQLKVVTYSIPSSTASGKSSPPVAYRLARNKIALSPWVKSNVTSFYFYYWIFISIFLLVEWSRYPTIENLMPTLGYFAGVYLIILFIVFLDSLINLSIDPVQSTKKHIYKADIPLSLWISSHLN